MTALAVNGSPQTTPLAPVALDPEALGYPDRERAAFERINNFFAPVVTSEQFVEWIDR